MIRHSTIVRNKPVCFLSHPAYFSKKCSPGEFPDLQKAETNSKDKPENKLQKVLASLLRNKDSHSNDGVVKDNNRNFVQGASIEGNRNRKPQTDSKAPEELNEMALVRKLLKSKRSTENASENYRDLLPEMKVDRNTKPIKQLGDLVNLAGRTRKEMINRKENFRRISDFGKQTKKGAESEKHIFSKETLGLFSKISSKEDALVDPILKWKDLNQSNVNSVICSLPRNHFKKQIVWTKQGKVWMFPIDNQQDVGDGSALDFSQHLFLDQNLRGSTAEDGAVKHFMELVCVALAKNPYLTVKEKEENILWFENFFQQNQIRKEIPV